VDELFRRTEATPGYELTADLPSQTVTDKQGLQLHFDIDPFRKQVLLEGLDEIGLTLKRSGEIASYEDRRQPSARAYEPLDFKLSTAN
jgi:3-isopropylmalate/(R)-2-methylmalate dehydratase small subunit